VVPTILLWPPSWMRFYSGAFSRLSLSRCEPSQSLLANSSRPSRGEFRFQLSPFFATAWYTCLSLFRSPRWRLYFSAPGFSGRFCFHFHGLASLVGLRGASRSFAPGKACHCTALGFAPLRFIPPAAASFLRRRDNALSRTNCLKRGN